MIRRIRCTFCQYTRVSIKLKRPDFVDNIIIAEMKYYTSNGNTRVNFNVISFFKKKNLQRLGLSNVKLLISS